MFALQPFDPVDDLLEYILQEVRIPVWPSRDLR